MELWIRSQSKLSLVKVNVVAIEKKRDNVFFITSDEWRLGTYPTENRALEVLDEIQNLILTTGNNNKTTFYEMPKE